MRKEAIQMRKLKLDQKKLEKMLLKWHLKIKEKAAVINQNTAGKCYIIKAKSKNQKL